jgi:hypothetical protein
VASTIPQGEPRKRIVDFETGRWRARVPPASGGASLGTFEEEMSDGLAEIEKSFGIDWPGPSLRRTDIRLSSERSQQEESDQHAESH